MQISHRMFMRKWYQERHLAEIVQLIQISYLDMSEASDNSVHGIKLKTGNGYSVNTVFIF